MLTCGPFAHVMSKPRQHDMANSCITHTRQRFLKNAHAGSRTRVTSMGGLYDTATLRAPHNVLATRLWCGNAFAGYNKFVRFFVFEFTDICSNILCFGVRSVSFEVTWLRFRVEHRMLYAHVHNYDVGKSSGGPDTWNDTEGIRTPAGRAQ